MLKRNTRGVVSWNTIVLVGGGGEVGKRGGGAVVISRCPVVDAVGGWLWLFAYAAYQEFPLLCARDVNGQCTICLCLRGSVKTEC